MNKLNSTLAIALIMGLLALSSLAQKSIEGHWEGTMTREGSALPVSFDFTNEAGKLKASFNSPTQRAMGIPLSKVSFAAPKLHFELVGDVTTIIFDGDLSAETITGQFLEKDARGTFFLKRIEATPPPFKQEEISFQNGTAVLSGTLLLPLKKTPRPAVVFLHGSGAEGRFASRFLAEYFTRYGIAALIYDKRGVGKSTGDWKRSNFEDLAGDGIAAVNFLRQRKEIDPKQIGVYGHSQGGMLAPLVASHSKNVAFVISGAGSAVPLYEAEINSITNQVKAKGVSGDELDEAVEFIKLFVGVLRTGEGWEQFDAETERVRDKRWYPMLHVPPKDNWFWSYYKQIASYNAADHWSKVTVPALVMYGEQDIYVPVARSIKNVDQALRRSGNQDYTILVLPRASHSFFIEPQEQDPFEWKRLSPGFPELLTTWILRPKRA